MPREELDFDHNPQQGKEDANLAVRFYTMPLKSETRSIAEGRPIYVDTDMIEIRVRGDRNNVVQRPVRPEDTKRFRDAYRAFKEDSTPGVVGTLLTEWPIMSSSMAEELKYLGFQTVEQLSTADDAACGKVPGLTTMKQKALAFLELAQGSAPLEKLHAELQAANSKNETLLAQVTDLAARLTAMEAGKGAQPAAPRKS